MAISSKYAYLWGFSFTNIAVVYKTPTFESAVRKAVRLCQQDIRIFNIRFQLEETAASKLVLMRYIPKKR